MKDFRKMLASKDMNAQTASLFETMARDNIKDFLEFFRKDYFAKIDFDKGCELLDEAMPHFLPPNHTVRKDAFNLFVKAPLKKGGVGHFLIHTIFDMAKGQIQVGIADVPDDVMAAYHRSKDNKSSGMGKKQEYTDANQCSNCGRTDLPLH